MTERIDVPEDFPVADLADAPAPAAAPCGAPAPGDPSDLLGAILSLHAADGADDLHQRVAGLLSTHLGLVSWSLLEPAPGGDGSCVLRATTRPELALHTPFALAAADGLLARALGWCGAATGGLAPDPGFPAVIEWQGLGVPLAGAFPAAVAGDARPGVLVCHEFAPTGLLKSPAETHRWLAAFAAQLAVAALTRRALEEARAGAERARRQVDFLSGLGRLAGLRDARELVPRWLDALMAACGAQGGALLLERDEKLCREAERGLLDQRVTAIQLATRHPLVNECSETSRIFLIPDARTWPKLAPATVPAGIASLLVMPLRAEGKPLGVLVLAGDAARGAFSAADQELLVAVAETATAVLTGAVAQRSTVEVESKQQEYALAGRVQRALLPGRVPDLAGLALDGVSASCEGGGGDYYDFVKLSERKVGIAIGDVSGHGLQVAVLLMGVRAFLRARAEVAGDPGELLAQLNAYVKPDIKQGMIMSLLYGVLDLEEGEFRFASAGHDAPALYRAATGVFEEPDRAGPALGMLGGARFAVERMAGLAPGDRLVLFTDGVWEQHDGKGEQFGRRRVLAAVRDQRHLPPNEFIKALRGVHAGFRGAVPQEDDWTVVAAGIRAVG
ncbi:MAG: SpoIIE family protein phosphatase [Planctomycetes bacterium]|nr:SpoIIE family protein phosphatase [Planctomycetota bacterium]